MNIHIFFLFDKLETYFIFLDPYLENQGFYRLYDAVFTVKKKLDQSNNRNKIKTCVLKWSRDKLMHQFCSESITVLFYEKQIQWS